MLYAHTALYMPCRHGYCVDSPQSNSTGPDMFPNPAHALEKRSNLFERVHALREPRQKRKHMKQTIVLGNTSAPSPLKKRRGTHNMHVRLDSQRLQPLLHPHILRVENIIRPDKRRQLYPLPP